MLGKTQFRNLGEPSTCTVLIVCGNCIQSCASIKGEKRDTETQLAGARTQMTLQGNRLRGGGKYSVKKAEPSAGDVKSKGFQGKAEVNFRHVQQLRKHEEDTSLFC